jgi:hypothetical protein
MFVQTTPIPDFNERVKEEGNFESQDKEGLQ